MDLSDFRFEFEKFYQLVALYLGLMGELPYRRNMSEDSAYTKHCSGFVDELRSFFLVREMILNMGNEIRTNLNAAIDGT